MRTIDDPDQIELLNKLSIGRTILRIAYNEDGIDYLTLHFSDGSKIILSTLGAIEIESPPNSHSHAAPDGLTLEEIAKYQRQYRELQAKIEAQRTPAGELHR